MFFWKDFSYRRNWKELILSIFVNISQYMGGIVAYLILAIPIFTNVYADYSPGDLAQLISNYSFQSQYLIYFFTRLYDTLSELSVVAGNCRRVGELTEQMRSLGLGSLSSSTRPASSRFKQSSNAVEPISSTFTLQSTVSDDDRFLTVNHVTIRVPHSDRVLVQDLSFEFKKGFLIFILFSINLANTCIKQS